SPFMATRAETTRKPQSGWGRANRIAQSSMLAISIVASASALTAEPLEADASRTKPSTPITVERTASENAASAGLFSPEMSVSAFSAAQSNAARVLLAQELSG